MRTFFQFPHFITEDTTGAKKDVQGSDNRKDSSNEDEDEDKENRPVTSTQPQSGTSDQGVSRGQVTTRDEVIPNLIDL